MEVRVGDIAFRRVKALSKERLERSRRADSVFVVPERTAARPLAEAADSTRAALILVQDDEGRLVGLIAPDWVRQQIEKYKGVRSRSFTEAVRQLEEDPEEATRGFRHEWLNEARPELYWCEVGHYVDRCPCPHHEDADCSQT